MPTVSVIIPAFRPPGFAPLFRSIAANRDVDAEWIVVDDASGPEHDGVFQTLPDGVRLIRQPENRRQGAARNVGLTQASGRWIKFLDADDELDTGHLGALLSQAEAGAQQDTAIPFAVTKHVFAGGDSYVNDSWHDLPSRPHAQYIRQLVRPFLHHCGALFPRDLLTQLGGYDESLITDEDGDLLLRVLHAGYHFTPVADAHYVYAHHDGELRVSADDDIAKFRARVRVCDKVEAAYGSNMPPDVALALAQRLDKIAMNYWSAFPQEAKALIARARRLSPGYTPDLRGALRLIRRIAGPGTAFAAQGMYRRMRGRPKGGAQG